MNKLYQRINYENSPSKKTPLSETNLNKMDKALDDLDNRIIEQDVAFAKSIAAEDKKIAEVNGKVSELTGTMADLTQSKSPSIICQASGETIIATDSSDSGFEQFKTYGWGKQDKTSGKNLLENTDTNHAYDGITYTANEDGSVTLNGTNTSDSAMTFLVNSRYGFDLPTGQEYILSGCPSGGGLTTYQLQVWNTDGNGGFAIDFGTGTKFSFSNESSDFNIAIVIRAGVTVSNLVFKPMIRLASIADDTWEPYTNGPSPNPEYPQPIVGAGQMLAKGNQLANLPDVEEVTVNGITWSCKNGVVTAKGTATNISAPVTAGIKCVIPIIAGTYTVSGSGGGATVYVSVKAADGTVSYKKNMSFTLDGTEQEVVLYCQVSSGVTVNESIYPMLNKGTTALPYEPYTGGVKKAVDVGIKHKLTGKNLYSGNDVVVANAYKGYQAIYFPIKDMINIHTLTLSFNPNGFVGKLTCLVQSNNSIILSGTEKRVSMMITPEYTNEKDCLIFNNTGAATSFNFTDIQLEYGTEATEYEPYTEQTLTLNRVLNGIPLGQTIPDAIKSSPAHMAGIYWDEKTQQYYIGDTEDGVNGVLVQRIYHKVFTGDEAFVIYTTGHDSIGYFGVKDTNPLCFISGDILTGAFCNRLQEIPSNTLWTTEVVGFGIDTSNGNYRIRLRIGEDVTSIDELSTKLKKWYNDGTPLVIDCILATPIETPLTDEEIAAYKALHSNKPTTIITNDAGCFMEVEYVADPKNHIEQNYVPVSKYTALEERISALEQLHV